MTTTKTTTNVGMETITKMGPDHWTRLANLLLDQIAVAAVEFSSKDTTAAKQQNCKNASSKMHLH